MKKWIAGAAIAVLVSGCLGSSDNPMDEQGEQEAAPAEVTTEDIQGSVEDLEESVDDLQESVDDLEDTVGRQLTAAEDRAEAAEAAEDRAEDRAEAAEDRAEAAEDRAKAAEDRAKATEVQLEQAESDLEELEDLAGRQRDELIRARTKAVFDGLAIDALPAGTSVTVNPGYREVSKPVTNPAVTFGPPTTSTSGRWFRSSFSSNSGTSRDEVVVYSDVEAPSTVPFKDSTYNAANAVVNTEGEIVGSIGIAGKRVDTGGSGFPSDSSGTPRTYDYVDNGEFTTEERDAEPSNVPEAYMGDFRDPMQPRFTAEVSGTLGGADGTYTCGADNADTPCTVQRVGEDLEFSGPWSFVPSSATAGVRVHDEEFVYFGWWARRLKSDDSWTYLRFHRGEAVTGDNLKPITSGSATYRGPATGHYAISELHGSEHGEFTARATLTADFGSDTVSGTIDHFSDHDDWTVTLNQRGIGDANASPTTTWTIDGAAHDGGNWSASFYSNLPADDRNGVVPTGIAGEFRAEHGDDARMIGVFGAHREQ